MGIEKVILPAMGEGIFEATITQWLVNVGDKIEEDDSLVEIATDKVDSEIPAPVSGIIKEILVVDGDIAKIGQEIVIIETQGNGSKENNETSDDIEVNDLSLLSQEKNEIKSDLQKPTIPHRLKNGAFLSPLVRRIAEKEGVSEEQVNAIVGTGINGRITKEDIVSFISGSVRSGAVLDIENQSVEIVEMDRMRMLIADNMVKSKQIAPHVTSFHEVDVTNIVNWRNKHKDDFLKKYKQKLTFTPIFIEAVANAVSEFPRINVSVVDNKIHVKKQVNIGMATALPDGNLIVPVIKNASALLLNDLASQVNDLANRARNKKLKPAEIQGGTFTITNVGAFGNLSGTPIINQPEVAILAIGSIKKRPAVIETPQGDLIGIRHQMILSLSYDHRVVDGSLGGLFLKKIADLLENFDVQKGI